MEILRCQGGLFWVFCIDLRLLCLRSLRVLLYPSILFFSFKFQSQAYETESL